MDAHRFDRISVAIATGASRRRAIGTVVGLGCGTLLGWSDPIRARSRNRKKKPKKQSCSAGNPIRCGRFCCRRDESCVAGECKHHCEDGRRNRGETDVDCGRVCHAVLGNSPFGLCGIRQKCEVNDDCGSGICKEMELGAGKICVECRQDVSCGTASTTPRCIDNFCFECAADFDCPSARPLCVAAAECPNNKPCVCGTCRVDDDCPAGQVCDERGRCFECFDDSDCTGRPGRPVCVDNVCQECGQDGDCSTAGDVCILGTCRTPAVCPAGRDLCTQGFVAATACGSGCRCRTTTEAETRCVGLLESRCDAQPACRSRSECEDRHGPGALCVRDTGSFCGCSVCALQCV